MTLAKGTKIVFGIHAVQLLAAVGVLASMTLGHANAATWFGFITTVALVAAFGAWSRKLLPLYDDANVIITQGGVTTYSELQLGAFYVIAGIGALFVFLGGLALTSGGGGIVIGIGAIVGGFALLALRPALVIDLQQRVATRYAVGTQFPLVRTVFRLDECAGLGVVLYTKVMRGSSFSTWHLRLFTKDKSQSFTVEEVAVGNDARWDALCAQLNVPKLVPGVAVAA